MGSESNSSTHNQPPASSAPTLWRRVRRWLVIVLLTYVGVSVLVAAFQRKLMYFPEREYTAVPTDVGLEFEDLTLRTSDGLSIAAWYMPHEAANGSIIFFHGNAGNLSGRVHTLKLLHGFGLNVLAIDYRGFGRSEGKPSELGTYADAEAAWNYLIETRGESSARIILFGRSLGGAVAIELAGQHSPAALVTESTFTNMVDIGRLHYPLLPVRLIVSYLYDSIEKVQHLTCPKLFLHGREDSLIPIANGRKLFDAAAEPKEFVETPGDHNEAGFTYSPEFTKRVQHFIEKALRSSE